MGALGTFHFTLDHNKGGGTPLSETVVVTEVEGDVVSPDSISIKFAGTFGRFAVKSSIVTIGDDSYMTNPVTGVWEQVSTGVSPLGFFDPQEGIGAMMTKLQDGVLVSRTPKEYRIDGTLEVEALRPLLGNATHGSTVEAALTIDAETMFLKKAVLEGRGDGHRTGRRGAYDYTVGIRRADLHKPAGLTSADHCAYFPASSTGPFRRIWRSFPYSRAFSSPLTIRLS